MAVYRLRAESWTPIRSRLLVMGCALVTLLVGFLGWVNPEALRSPLLLSICLGALGTGFYQGYRRTRRQWESFTLELDGDHLIRRQAGLEDLRLSRAEVVGIVELPGRSMTVKGPTRFQLLVLGPSLDGYEELADALRSWAPLQTAEHAARVPQMAMLLGTVALVGILMTLAFSRRPVVPSTVAAGILVVGLLAAFVEIRRSPHVDAKVKRNAWWVVFPAGACLVRVVTYFVTGE